jgi:hypothetical protein
MNSVASKHSHTTNNSIDSTNQESAILPAIKFRIAAEIASLFHNQMEITKEINRCQPLINKKKIKFASIRDNLIIIATDDKSTHSMLTKSWPTDAFKKGIRPIQKIASSTTSKPKQIIIKGVHKQINIDDEEIQAQLAEQGLNNSKRIISKNNETTTLIKAEVNTQGRYEEIINNGIFIGYSKCKVEPARTIIQCFKCQKTGHTHSNCTTETVCLKCSGNHQVKDCTPTEIKCANCSGAHYACARKCPFLKEETKNNTRAIPLARTQENRSYAQMESGNRIRIFKEIPIAQT